MGDRSMNDAQPVRRQTIRRQTIHHASLA